MDTFVIARPLTEEVVDYLHQDGFSWTESRTHAKWYHSEKEAQADFEKWKNEYPICELRRIHPVGLLTTPLSEGEHAAAMQELLRAMLHN